MITSNTGPRGELDTDALQRAVLQYRNTPDPEAKISPAMCIFGRPIKDFIPILPGRYRPHPTWRETMTAREEALRNRHMKAAERWTEHTKRLPPLAVGNHIRLQNQTGPHPTRWDKTGVIIEVRQFDQYVVRIDGSGRVTLRNRKFLRRYEPVVPQRPKPRTLEEDLRYSPTVTPIGAHEHMPQTLRSSMPRTAEPAATLPPLAITAPPAVTPAPLPSAEPPSVPSPAPSTSGMPRVTTAAQPTTPAAPPSRPNVARVATLCRGVGAPGTPPPDRTRRARQPPAWQKDYVMC
ncbi:PREDICTED: translation initiation factor IF-2-like [Priapulus caudatus]|uniref:Translation initiation factor IF-2-like n=1 Tax=Priapulus caudatus TaxID=37621 RepID=A0ABM1E4M3_PRICU|nr:PREDICTED: translation initiation factor IF-2-like [Priapulus caudatus]